MSRSPPISTLFPYTTLFRSIRFEENQRGRDNEMENSELPARFAARCRSYRRSRPSLRRRENSGNGSQPVQDRKSTRLNSSHTVISYAVFCLKKKKKTKIK